MTTGFHIHSRYTAHVTPAAHPERPERIEHLLNLKDRAAALGVGLFPSARKATAEELGRVHTPAHVDAMAATAGREYVMLDPDTHTSESSYDVALHAAGALLDTVDAVMERRIDNGFAAVRPPGHHAEADSAMGFCLFNNVAVAARHLVERHGLERVLIVDWDVHHGNGTQNSFYDDPRVLYASLHQYPFYPGTGGVDEIGRGEGRGFNVNIPFPGGVGDDDYLAAFDTVILPIARCFKPQFVLVSAGFDAHWSDPLANMQVTEGAFAAMANGLLAIADEFAEGRLAAVLEGGYNLDALVSCVEIVLRAMCAFDKNAAGEAGEVASELMAEALLGQVVDVHRDIWGL